MTFNQFDSLLDSALALNSNREILYCNEAFANLIEIPKRRIKELKVITEFVGFPPDFWLKLQSASGPFEATPYAEMGFISSSGNEMHCQYSVQLIHTEIGDSYLIYFRDVTLERKLHSKYKKEISEKEDYIKQLDRKLFETRFLFEISTLINTNDLDSGIMNQVLRKACETFSFDRGYFVSSQENQGLHEFQLENMVRGYLSEDQTDTSIDVLTSLKDILLKNLTKTEPFAFLKNGLQYILVPLAGKNTSFSVMIFERSKPMELHPADLDLMRVMGQQISLSMDNEVLFYKSITDERTKLFNPRYFAMAMGREVNRSLRTKTAFGLIMIDIDHFKKFNDTYGHAIGDSVLKHVAQLITASVRNTDTACRYGGEEFAVIMVDSPAGGIKLAAERIRAAIENTPLNVEGHGSLRVTVSIGLALCPEDAGSEKGLLDAADRALYHAKSQGRNNVQIFDSKIM